MTEIELTNAETMRHILTLRAMMMQCMQELINRANDHDLTKLSDPEVTLFTEYTPKLKDVEYNSPEYKQFLVELKPALDNHYAKNSHHPEYYADGVNGMNLFDLIEMLCDWKSSSLRGVNGDLSKSLDMNIDRFKISEQTAAILRNTVPFMNRFAIASNIKTSYPN